MSVRGVLSATELERAFQRERSRVDRNAQCFSLVVFQVSPRRSEDLRRAAELLVERVRTYDDVGVVDGERLAALLPETDGAGSWVFADNALDQLRGADLGVSCDVYTYPHPDKSGDPYGRVTRGGAGAEPGVGSAGPSPFQSEAPRSSGYTDRRPTGTHGAAPLEQGSVAVATASPLTDDGPRLHPVRPTRPQAQPDTEAQINPQAESASEPRPVRDLEPLFVEPLPKLRRALDIFVSGSALLALSPILGATALAVKLTSPGPIIFSQLRAGRGAQPFRFYKFRSMYQDAEERKNELRLVNEADGPIFKIKNDPRITPVGRIIRKISVDELPQLFNVLRGDMTLVGPRPPVMDEVDAYAPWQRRRLEITGGLTCIWQVSGRSEVSFDDWMRMDLRYKRERNGLLDMKLVWRTFGAVFSGRGAY